MDMKSYLEGVITKCDSELADLNQRNEVAQSVEEMRSITKDIVRAQDAKAEAQRALETLGKEDEARGFNPIASYGGKAKDVHEDVDVRSSMEYRKAFMDYAQGRGTSEILQRAAQEQISEDLGILLPNTIVQRIMTDVQKVYGQIYSKVRKTNVKGGVQYPIGTFSAKMYWDGQAGDDPEHGVTENQTVGKITGYIQFTYHIAEIRIAQSLLQSILTVQAFEDEVVKAFLEAYVREMDQMILSGNGVTQPEGILTELAKGAAGRIPEANIIKFNESEMEDWKSWQKNLFSKIPLSMRKLRPEFIMTAETWEANIMTLVDDNNNPLARETYNATTGDEKCSFKGREVTLVEEGGIKSFDAAEDGEVFGIYWVPSEAYLINSQMQFSYKKWFDDYTNQWITKGILICDGKILDPKYLYILMKD